MDLLQLRLSLCLTAGFPSFPLPLREALEYHMVPKSWHCQNWVDPPTTLSWHLGEFGQQKHVNATREIFRQKFVNNFCE